MRMGFRSVFMCREVDLTGCMSICKKDQSHLPFELPRITRTSVLDFQNSDYRPPLRPSYNVDMQEETPGFSVLETICKDPDRSFGGVLSSRIDTGRG